jgi:hypothetical protein
MFPTKWQLRRLLITEARLECSECVLWFLTPFSLDNGDKSLEGTQYFQLQGLCPFLPPQYGAHIHPKTGIHLQDYKTSNVQDNDVEKKASDLNFFRNTEVGVFAWIEVTELSGLILKEEIFNPFRKQNIPINESDRSYWPFSGCLTKNSIESSWV